MEAKVDTLRKKYPQFFYKGYSYEVIEGDLHISFDFRVPAMSEIEGYSDIEFRPHVIIKNVSKKNLQAIREKTLQNFVFHLGLIEIPSYWKATCSPEIIIDAGYLTAQQRAWWKDLLLKGMGEFFFRNKINFVTPDFLSIAARPGLVITGPGLADDLLDETLVPVGGGKDAAVTLELLLKAQQKIQPFVLNPTREQCDIIQLAGARKPIIVERTIDPKLLELNQKGYLNGHTPFSAYLAFLSVFVGTLFKIKYIAFSHERSSNQGNLHYLGEIINHQYSKSYEFEKKFRRYTKKYLIQEIECFSFLRPLYELQIAKIFTRYPKYFKAFLSCNEARKTASGTKKPTEQWCAKCAKCLFVFVALRAFLAEQQVLKIFGTNLLNDTHLNPLLKELTGQKAFKPFECVGTAQETRAALSLALGKKKDHAILHAWNKRHFLPMQFERILKRALI